MAVSDILEQYADTATCAGHDDASNDYGRVAPLAPRDIVKGALMRAFNAAPTAPFAEIVARLFAQANPQQRAGMLRILLEAAGRGEVTDGVLSHVPGRVPEAPYEITGRDAEKVKPEQVRELAVHAEKRSPGVIDGISAFLVQHPDLVKALDHATLIAALHDIAERMRS
ncbi:MAG: hypothetical protein ACM3SS_20015 [Rhodospirillaceae bacterium]